MNNNYIKAYIKTECPICFENCETIFVSKCGHAFCKECVEKMSSDKCNICQHELPYSEKNSSKFSHDISYDVQQKIGCDFINSKITNVYLADVGFPQSNNSYDCGNYLVFEYITEKGDFKSFSIIDGNIHCEDDLNGYFILNDKETQERFLHGEYSESESELESESESESESDPENNEIPIISPINNLSLNDTPINNTIVNDILV